MRKLSVFFLLVFLTAGCVAHQPGQPSPARALGQVFEHLLFAPMMIVAGLFEGIATAPYLIEGDLHDMNVKMEAAKANVTLDETYQYAYQRRLENVPKSGDTGRVFHHMRDVTAHFQKVLKGYGVDDPERYLLTAVRSADHAGYTLYGLIYRPAGPIRIRDRNGGFRTLTPVERAYYTPYERDAAGYPLDVVIDWAGVPRTTIKTQKGQAILMTLAANSVLINRRNDDYWTLQRRWMDGDFMNIVAERKVQLDQRMALKN